MIKIISIGKAHEAWIQDGLERYQKRLRAPWNIEWVLLPHSPLEGLRARTEESERILSRLSPTDYVILLDETGKNFRSPAIGKILENKFSEGRQVIIVIGGAYGVNGALQQLADLTWSLSKLVFPHQLVRIILVEQIYRMQEIAKGSGYHHS